MGYTGLYIANRQLGAGQAKQYGEVFSSLANRYKGLVNAPATPAMQPPAADLSQVIGLSQSDPGSATPTLMPSSPDGSRGSWVDGVQPVIPTQAGGNTEIPTDPVDDGSAMKSYAQFALGFSAAAGAVGVYAQVLAGKDQLKSQEISLKHKQFMSVLNARQAADDANNIRRAGRLEIARMTMAAGQRKSSLKTSAAARGVDGSSGSAAEILASEDIIKEIDMMTINQNTVRAAGQAMTQSTNYSNQGLMAGVSAGNLRRTSRSMNEYVAGATSAVNSVGQYAVAMGAIS